MGRTTWYKIVSEKFKFRKLCAHWVPRLLTEEQIRSFGWDQIDHRPYSPDLAPSDFQLFRYLKELLDGKRFATDEKMKEAVQDWLSS